MAEEKQTKKQIKGFGYLIVSLIWLFCFLIFIVLLKTVDIGVVGPENSEIGFSTMNKFIFDTLGQSEFWYNFTKIMGYASILIAIIFMCFGLYQLIKYRSLKNVDGDLIAMAITFVMLAFIYVLFEIVKINYRPVLVDGVLEASFPSSHTMLNLTIFTIMAMFFSKKIDNIWVRRIGVVVISLLMILSVVGRLLSGVHWFTDILGAVMISVFLCLFYEFLSKTFYREIKRGLN